MNSVVNVATRRTGRPTSKQSESLRDDVLSSVRRTMRLDGGHLLSLEEIAARAGITKLTLYRRFGSKRGLLEAAAEAEVLDLRRRFAADDLPAQPAFDQLRLAAKTVFAWTVDPETINLFNFLAAEAAGSPDLGKALSRLIENVVTPLAELMARCETSDAVIATDTSNWVLVLIDLLSGAAQRLQSGFTPETVYGGMSLEDYFSMRWIIFVRSAGLVSPQERVGG